MFWSCFVMNVANLQLLERCVDSKNPVTAVEPAVY